MVGVPGRSRACATCKKRRIACDSQVPPCGPCLRASRECTFPQKHIFVLNTQGSYKTIYRKRTDPREQGATDDGVRTRYRSGDLDEPGIDPRFKHSSVAIISRPFGTLTALKQQLLVDAYAGNSVVTHEPYRGRPWALAITGFAGSIHALESAPLACYASWIGRRDGLPYLVEVSRRLYVQGLREVQQAITKPDKALLDETFGACLALIIYEALECPDRSQTGYDVHIDGCSRLVKLRGASMHREGAAHDLFRAFRFIDILRGFETHKSTYLSSKTWTTLPWQKCPGSKSNWDRLVDLLADGPEVLQKADRLESLPPERSLPAMIELIEDLLVLENRMQAYHTSLLSSYPEPLFWEANPSVPATNEFHMHSMQIVSRSGIHFHDLDLARILTLYWSTLAMIWSGLNDLWAATQALLANNLLGPQIHRSLALEPRDWLDPIRKVCQSVNYCKTEEPTGQGHMMIAAPLDMVLGVMRNRSGCEFEYEEAKRAREEISRNWLRVLQFSNYQV